MTLADSVATTIGHPAKETNTPSTAAHHAPTHNDLRLDIGQPPAFGYTLPIETLIHGQSQMLFRGQATSLRIVKRVRKDSRFA